ncbi:DNA cytosine methyltransferase [Hydromonas duriensis]|uniref:DNA (cytosine-5-)-methyltransferase n=1 Tax=Hydromonas duriensis TaxID=1527608 RepID=A0A4R6Y5F7_9BURK|nr:DNA cytosine methyltransferase [Hydromonas duriensis]TDR30657.1 DNA (cytosine-5)-methyltransferase 1 [Hydromonas duriensis]
MPNTSIHYGSLCSGIEAATVAWQPLGWQASWFSEINPFACAVLASHYPLVPNLGDMTALSSRILNGDVVAPDVLVGGTPCQAFSVAGNRDSLQDARGNLTLTYVEILDAIDLIRRTRHQAPAIAVWENVPGVLTTKDNAFGCFLGALAGAGCELHPSGKRWTKSGCVYGHKRTIAWRVLDAQYFGLAQRRERVFVVSSARTDFDPSQVLFEHHSMCRHSAPSRDSRQSTANPVTTSPIGSDSENNLNAGQPAFSESGFAQFSPTHIAGTLRASGGANGLGSETLVTDVIAIRGNIINRSPQHGGNGVGVDVGLSPTLTGADRHAVAFDLTQVRTVSFQSNAGAAVSMPIGTEISPTLTTSAEKVAIFNSYEVRRLMPVECERLQGFPDHYTLVSYRGAPAKDSPRYAALGNSMAVPVMHWIGKRINHFIKELAHEYH